MLKSGFTLGYIPNKTSKEVTPITDLYSSLGTLVNLSKGKCKSDAPAIVMMMNGRLKSDFKGSNVAALDIDNKKTGYSIYFAKERLIERLKNIVFLQISHSEKLHIVYEIPYTTDYEQYIRYTYSFTQKFIDICKELNICNTFTVGYSGTCDIDLHSARPEQILFVSPFAPYFNTDIQLLNIDCYTDDELYNKFVLKKDSKESYVPLDDETDDKLRSTFTTTPEVKFVKDRIDLDFSYTIDELKWYRSELIQRINGMFGLIGGRLLFRPRIEIDGVYSHRLTIYVKRDKNNNVIKWEQGEHRRIRFKKYLKQFILNGIATVNFDSSYKTWVIDDILKSARYVLEDWFNLRGKTRKIDLQLTESLFNETFDEWDNIEVEYTTNKYWFAHDKIETQQDVLKYRCECRKRKNEKINETASDFISENNLSGCSNKVIADELNNANIEAKTKNGWSGDSVKKLMKLGNKIDIDVLMYQLLNERLSYSEIASKLNEMGLRTKQGKEYNKHNVMMIVKRNKIIVS